MRFILIALVHRYRVVAARTGFRRRCLFAVSCSHHVEAVLRASGAGAGLRAAWFRFRRCRPGYRFELGADGAWALVLVDGTAVPLAEAAAVIRQEANLLARVSGFAPIPLAIPLGDHPIR